MAFLLLWYPPLLCLLDFWNALGTFCHAKCSRINMNHFLHTGFLILCYESPEAGFETFLVDIVISELVWVWLYFMSWGTAPGFFLHPLVIQPASESVGARAPIWSMCSAPSSGNCEHWGWRPACTGHAIPCAASEWCMAVGLSCVQRGCNRVMPSGWGTDVHCKCVPVLENPSFLEW